jgi:hypothetical protein
MRDLRRDFGDMEHGLGAILSLDRRTNQDARVNVLAQPGVFAIFRANDICPFRDHSRFRRMAVPMLPHRRNAPRRRVLKTGSIEFSDTSIECTVRDMSESGAALQAVTPLYIPDRFILFIPSEQSKRTCRIIWRTGKRMGVAFD